MGRTSIVTLITNFYLPSLNSSFFATPLYPLVGQDLPIIEDSWSHSDTPQSVRLLWMSDQPDAETSTWQQATLTKNIHASGGIRP